MIYNDIIFGSASPKDFEINKIELASRLNINVNFEYEFINQYIDEFNKIGFNIEKFIEMNVSTAIPYSASIYVRKGK